MFVATTGFKIHVCFDQMFQFKPYRGRVSLIERVVLQSLKRLGMRN
jgi:hypothetical protein